MDTGNCIRCGQAVELAPLAVLTLDVSAAATERNVPVPQASRHIAVGICETCTWAVVAKWPSAVGMCAHVREIERRSRADRRASVAARTGGRRSTDRVVVLPAGKSE